MSTDSSREEMIRRIKGSSLLALPQSAAKILELGKDPENGPPEYAVPISADPGLTAQILRFANSSFFGFRNKITTVQMALSLISTRTIKNFVIWNAVFSLLPDPRIGPFRLKVVFQDAIRRAVFCKTLGGHTVLADPEEVFVAGLFQDIAVPVLAQNWPEEYENLLYELERRGGHLSRLERERFGWSHADVGAIMVKEWGFGDDFARTVSIHTSYDFDRIRSEEDLFDAIVCLSSLLPDSIRGQWNDADRFFSSLNRILQKQFLRNEKRPDISELLTEVDVQYGDMLQITGLTPPSSTLLDFYKVYQNSFGDDGE